MFLPTSSSVPCGLGAGWEPPPKSPSLYGGWAQVPDAQVEGDRSDGGRAPALVKQGLIGQQCRFGVQDEIDHAASGFELPPLVPQDLLRFADRLAQATFAAQRALQIRFRRCHFAPDSQAQLLLGEAGLFPLRERGIGLSLPAPAIEQRE